jgi:DNA-binding beta-propeller fold protein YncE
VGAVLGDALHRVAVLGGREGMPRSLGSVYGGSVTRFLGGGLRGVVSRVIAVPPRTWATDFSDGGIAVSPDDRSVLLSGMPGYGFSIVQVGLGHGDACDTAPRMVGGPTSGPLRLVNPCQVYVAPDGFVFIADHGNTRVAVLCPDLTFHSAIGTGALFGRPSGVCANADIVVVTQTVPVRISVLRRANGKPIRHFSSQGRVDGKLLWPVSVCFLPGDRLIAVADTLGDRVSVFSVDGDFIRTVGDGVLSRPCGVACSSYGELVVADGRHRRICVFDDAGAMLHALGGGRVSGVALHGCTVVASDQIGFRCVVFE